MALLIASPWIADKLKDVKIVYCHIEQKQLNSNYSRSLCTNMKIVSQDMDQVNLSQFNNINATFFQCYDNIEELPDCDSNNFYFTTIKLTDLCWDCKTRGYLCSEYQLKWQDNDTEIRNEFNNYTMITRIESKETLREMLKNCTG